VNEDFETEDLDEGLAQVHTDEAAIEVVREFFDARRDRVMFSRQVEVLHESDWFHWITNRALRHLVSTGELRSERRALATSGSINLMWHRSFRYYRREAARLTQLVEEYADPNIGAALGLHGEAMALEGFASVQFVMKGREVRNYGDRQWTGTAHDVDFIFEKDGLAYGVEVKNTLGYMDHDEMMIKIMLCNDIGVTPVFVARMLPKTWILELRQQGGFALILKYQLYPWAHRDLAHRVRDALGLPVDSPRRLQAGTMQRFVKWHERRLL
jgi:hypothetical protein